MKAFPALSMLAVFVPLAAIAQNAPGSTLCDQQLQSTRDYIEQNRASLSDQARRDADRRLELARDECASDPVLGEAQLSNLQVGIGMTDTQTARLPSVEVDEIPENIQ